MKAKIIKYWFFEEIAKVKVTEKIENNLIDF